MKIQLSLDLEKPTAIPYFLWDEPMSVAQLKRRLETSSPEEQIRLLGKILREARDTDVWKFVSPQTVYENWEKLAPHLGRRRAFWKFLFENWRNEGLIGK